MGKMYHKSRNSMMTPGFSCFGINSQEFGEEGTFFLWGYLLGFFLSFIAYFQRCGFSQTVSMRNNDSLGNLWHTSGCALDFFFSCLGRGTGWMWRCFGSLGICFCVTVWFCFVSVCARKGLCILEFVPSLFLLLHVNWPHKKCHLSLQDLPFLYPWAVADTAVIVGICWICSSCEPCLCVFFIRVAGI